jgi:predicted neutral ceramidase superfamily lipid hydrolase
MIYGLRTGDENTFVAVVMIWSYMLTVMVALGTLVFAVLGMLGMKFRLVNTILGGALVVLALVTFIFALIVASKNTVIETLGDKESGVKVRAMITAYMMFAGLVAGGLQVYKARQK